MKTDEMCLDCGKDITSEIINNTNVYYCACHKEGYVHNGGIGLDYAEGTDIFKDWIETKETNE